MSGGGWSEHWIKLSPHECEVLQMLRLRKSMKWIGYELSISEDNVWQTAHRAYKKLGVNNRWDAALLHPRHRPTPNLPCLIRKARVRKPATL